MPTKRLLTVGTFFLILAVGFGAFGAHGLEKKVTDAALKVYETGVRYHFYHGFGLLILGLLQLSIPKLNLKIPAFLMVAGIVLFSFNCYLYTVTGIKGFAMIVPIGGTSFIAAWTMLLLKLKGHKF